MSLNRIKIPTTYFGKDILKQLKNQKNEKVLVVTDKQIYEIHGDLISKYLKSNQVSFFKEVLPEPIDQTVIEGADIAKKIKPDSIIGFGGGSVMDTAKMIYYLYECEDKTLYECSYAKSKPLGKKSKLILIPTTSGTGAEHTPAAVITNTKTNQKVILADPELVPHMVILDPILPLSMPSSITISTGIDAIVHAMEGLIAKTHSDFSDALNLYALRSLIEYLPLVAQERNDDILLREKIHNAASMAGMGCANSGCALAHSCGHALGAVHHIQHGIAVGIMLPYVIEFNKPQCVELYQNILTNMNIMRKQDPCEILANLIRNILKDVNIPLSLQNLKISAESWNTSMDKLIFFTKRDTIKILNPRYINDEEMYKLFDYAYYGKQIDF